MAAIQVIRGRRPRYGKPTRYDIAKALHSRIDALVGVLPDVVGAGDGTATNQAAHEDARLERICEYAATEATRPELWLIYSCLAATYPEDKQLDAFYRTCILAKPHERARDVLALIRPEILLFTRVLRRVQIVRNPEVLVDTTFCASFSHNTGIQRVVRSTVPIWVDDGLPIRLARWRVSGGYSDLDDYERAMVLDWPVHGSTPQEWESSIRATPYGDRPLLVPWKTTLGLVEVPDTNQTAQLACLAQSSGNRVVILGYDTIPIGSADTFTPLEPEKFARYCAVVKHADIVAPISETASKEFVSLVSAYPVQGIEGPHVVTVPLASAAPEVKKPSLPAESVVKDNKKTPLFPPDDTKKLVICVGSHEPRKNQTAVLNAAETIMRAGCDFRMVFVGAGNIENTAPFDKHVKQLQKEGFAVTSHRHLDDAELMQLYGKASFSVFVSLHEGYGLPIVESLQKGTPVLTSNYGSMAEIAEQGGCVMVDPRDDDAIADAMKRLVEDDVLIDKLKQEAAAIPQRTWKTYADELWSAFFPEAE